MMVNRRILNKMLKEELAEPSYLSENDLTNIGLEFEKPIDRLWGVGVSRHEIAVVLLHLAASLYYKKN